MQTACREYVNSTPTNTARTELHSMTTSLHANTRGSRAGRLRIAHLSSTCHVSFLAAPDTDHKHKFPLTFLTYLSDSITNTHKTLVHDPYVPCEVPRQSGGSTQIPALTGYEPKTIETNTIETNTIETNSIGTEAIESEGLEPRRIELDRNHGTDPCQIQERFMRSSLTEDVAEYGKVGVVYVRSRRL